MDNEKVKYLQSIAVRGILRADGAIRNFPQPTYCLLKVAEEAGEVVKAGVHLAEGRDFSHDDLEEEIVDTIAMMFRVLIEGDGVIGLKSTFKGKTNA